MMKCIVIESQAAAITIRHTEEEEEEEVKEEVKKKENKNGEGTPMGSSKK